ncbi:MAG TPA: anti-sigma factor [Gaiellaceae bacterium]|nr:anti-sigma factor [Gaiellaceae bacterium]
MTHGPDFDELLGGEPLGPEREQLRRVHEMLLTAGPPPELPPHLEAGPNLAMTTVRRRRQVRRRVALLAAAAVAVAVVFLGGYITGNRGPGKTISAVRTIQLQGTAAAPDALASLRVQPEDESGNWPMTLDVTGLPALPDRGYYAVYLVRNGKPWASCGWFLVSGPHAGTTVTLNAPYGLRSGDTWIVTRVVAGKTKGAGETVMRPANA